MTKPIRHHIYLSRRNLQVLLSKLDRKLGGDKTACTIIKYKNKLDPPEYQQTADEICVTAVEDEEYYVTRPAGAMHPSDEPVDRHATGKIHAIVFHK